MTRFLPSGVYKLTVWMSCIEQKITIEINKSNVSCDKCYERNEDPKILNKGEDSLHLGSPRQVWQNIACR